MVDFSKGSHSTVCGLHEALSGQGSVVPKVLQHLTGPYSRPHLSNSEVLAVAQL